MAVNHDMAEKHEQDVHEILGGRRTKASGSKWQNPSDGRVSRYSEPHAFAWDCKSTFAASASISLAMWHKIVTQASPEMPLMPIRFYNPDEGTARLAVTEDLVALRLDDFAAILEDARAYRRLTDGG